MSETSPEQPGSTPEVPHGDPLLASAQGRGDGDDGSRHGADPAAPPPDGPQT